MASAAYRRWKAAGEPYRDAVCVTDLARTLRVHGYVVYTRGDDSHMQADTPEDHTPFSATGWPKASAFGVAHALDVMPPPKSSKLPTLAQLGAQIVKDRNAGVPGTGPIKYINWTTAGGKIVQDSWKPNHKQSSSNDSGHIHISMRSDMDDTRTTYDPVARFRGDDMSPAEKKLLADIAWQVRNVPMPDGSRGLLTSAVGAWGTKVAAQDKVIAALSGRPPVTPEELATIVTAAEAAARDEIGDALRAGADAVDPVT